MELSDIKTFAELPDGKVVSSTDAGALLMWEGNFIKFRVMRSKDHACHDGEVSKSTPAPNRTTPITGDLLDSLGGATIDCYSRFRWVGALLGHESDDGCRGRR